MGILLSLRIELHLLILMGQLCHSELIVKSFETYRLLVSVSGFCCPTPLAKTCDEAGPSGVGNTGQSVASDVGNGRKRFHKTRWSASASVLKACIGILLLR